MSNRFSRRKFLKGTISGISVYIALPIFDQLLNSAGTAFAQGAPLPKRFGTFFWGLGIPSIGGNDNFRPTGSGAGSAWSIPSSHALYPLNNHKEYLTVFSNYNYQTANGAAHIPSRGLSVSASHNREWVLDSGASGFRNQSMPMPSIDTLIQQNWNTSLNTPNPFLNMSLNIGNLYVGTSSWGTGGAAKKFYKSPLEVYDNIFKGISSTTPAANTGPSISLLTNKFKKSVLDTTLADASSLANSLHPADKLRLDAHLQGVRDLERKIAASIALDEEVSPTPSPAQCIVPPPTNYASAAQITLRNAVMSDLLVYNLSCNLSRIFCYEFTPTQCSGTIPEIGLNANEGVHDAYSHGDTQDMRNYVSFVMKNLEVLVGKLKAKSEGTGNLLDQTLMLCTSEFGPIHYHNYHPYFYVGKAAGGLKGNYHSVATNSSSSEAARVLLTSAHAIGVPLAKVGMPPSSITGESSGTTPNYEATQVISSVLA